MIASCARLVGEPVIDRDGGEMGRVDRILVDVASGRIAGVVIAVGGVFGLGERQYTVPWRDLRMNPAHRCIVLDRPPAKATAESPLSTL